MHIDDVSFRKSADGPVERGNLEVVQTTTNKQFYVRLVGSSDDVIEDIITSLRNFGWDENLIAALRKDLEDSFMFRKLFKGLDEAGRIKLAKAWKLIREALGNFTEYRLDSQTLKQIVKMMDSQSVFRMAFQGDWELKLKLILVRHNHLSCPSCSRVFLRGPTLPKFLKDVEFIIANYSATSSIGSRFWKWIFRETKDGNPLAVGDGNLSEAYQFLNYLRKNNIVEADIKHIDGAFFDEKTSKKFDIELKNGTLIFIEFKNKKFLTYSTIPDNDVYQFMHGPLQKIDNFSQYNYVAFLKRFGGSSSDQAISHLKSLWQNVFQGPKKDDIFEAIWGNQNLRESLWDDIPDVISSQIKDKYKNKFYDLAGETSSELYSFIKAQ